MARKTTKANAPAATEPEVKAHTFDRTMVDAAFKARPKSVDAVNKSMDKLAGNLSTDTFQRALMLDAYFYGLAQQAEVSAPFSAKLWEDRFEVFKAKHYGNNLPAETTIRNLKSATMAFFEAAFVPWKLATKDAMIKEVASITNVQLGWRSGRIRELIWTGKGKNRKFVDKADAPDDEAIAEALAPEQKDLQGSGSTPEEKIKGFMRDAVKLLADKDVRPLLAKDEPFDWLEPMLKSMRKHREMDGSLNAVAKKAIAESKALDAPQPAAPPRGRRRANVGTVGHA